MKYSEFNKKYADLELQYTDTEMYIYCDGIMIGKVSRQWRYLMSTHYEGFELLPIPVAVKLFADMAMLSETPLAEREEEERYYLKYNVPSLIVWGCSKDPRWLHVVRHSGYSFICEDRTDDENVQTIFTESEIAQMDITGFQKVEVSE